MKKTRSGFTIVELIVVVMVIGIIAGIVIVAYTGAQNKIKIDAINNDLKAAAGKLSDQVNFNNTYPADQAAFNALNIKPSGSGTTYTYISTANTYCLVATRGSVSYYITASYAVPLQGDCTMQTSLAANCTALTTYTGNNETAIQTLIDSRDNKQYRIAKLADGKCWMLDNLKLGSTSGVTALAPANTNITSNWSLPQVIVHDGVNYYDQPKAFGPVTGDTGSGATNYGYLYNWCAATAGGTASGGNNTCTVSGTLPASPAAGDICPKNWRLPTANTGGEFSALDIAFGGTGNYAVNGPSLPNWRYTGPFKGVFAGHTNGGSPGFAGQGVQTSWHSRSMYTVGTSSQTVANMGNNDLQPNNSDYRADGLSVRCVLN